MQIFDKDKNGTVNYDEFLVAIRPPLNESRLKVINMAFEKMDKNGDGVVTVEDLKMTYNVRFHPAYINGWCSSLVQLTSRVQNLNASDSEALKFDVRIVPEINFLVLHPPGTLSEEEVLKHYLAKFERNGSVDGILTIDEFLDYYSCVSASIDDDGSLDSFSMRNCSFPKFL